MLSFVFDGYQTFLAALLFLCVMLYKTYVLLCSGILCFIQIPFNPFSPLLFGYLEPALLKDCEREVLGNLWSQGSSFLMTNV